MARPETRLTLIVGLAALLPCTLAVHALREERGIAAAQEEIERAHLREPDQGAPIVLSNDSDAAPPRLDLALALLQAQQAARQPAGSQRDTMLADARHRADRAVQARPEWGEALLVSAYIASLQSRHSRESLTLLDRSYRASGFLGGSAAWRVAYGIAHWDRLPATTQDHIVEEAVWLARHKVELRRDVFALARGTPAYRPLLKRWRDLRIKDGNFYTTTG